MRQLRIAGCLGLSALALTVAACGSSSDDSTSTSASTSSSGASTAAATTGAAKPTGTAIKLGWINPGVGTGSVFPHATAAAKAAVSYINDSLGGVDGHPLELVSCDSDGSPESDANCAQTVLGKKPLTLSMDQVFNMAGVYQAQKPTGIPIIGAVPTGPEDNTAANTIWLSGGAPGALRNWGKWLSENVKPKSVGVVYDNPAAAAGIDLLTGDLKKGGATITSKIIDPKSADYLAAYQAVTADKPDILIGLIGAESTCIGIAKAAQSQQSTTPFYVTDTCTSPAVAKAAGSAIKGWNIMDINFERDTTTPSADWKIYQAAIDKYAEGQTDAKSPGSFGTIMTLYSVLKGLGADATSKQVYDSFKTKPGKVFMGGDYDCAKADPELPDLCVSQYQIEKIENPGGPLTYAPNGHLFSYSADGVRTGG
jgi:branched-chain amino acid transport system substrate-binding protein